MRVLVVGYGAAGRPIADGLASSGANVTAVDGVVPDDSNVPVLPRLPEDLGAWDLVITVVTSAATLALARDIAARPGTPPVLDLSSSPADLMAQVHRLLGDRLVDGVILGAVALGRHRTPLLFAGGPAGQVADMLAPLGCRITVLPDAGIGDAGKLKLLRSVFTKGIEALVVELHQVASAMGQVERLPKVLADLEEGSFHALTQEMLRTHPRHAARRLHEIEDAQAAIHGVGLASPMTDAAHAVFERTSKAGPGPDTSPAQALEWLVARA
ncbi:DUF1932 domain-containing protein [Falsirhodobacter halotolerans]|uniref:DUF1932 domain-containing protein n=1 Tax=Falsirhodobacter halotolerans TaxID=1146892 RepID=UPI001FD4E9F8|nr:DUF1932 domain-containing protein [Falsirhodobacter halotolerans]MCJ8139870.1 DUF1932 domain-containing protein [Falsirhodobacter halotolerans]